MPSRRRRNLFIFALFLLLYACGSAQKGNVSKQASIVSATPATSDELADTPPLTNDPTSVPTPAMTPVPIVTGSVTARSNVRDKPTTDGSAIIGKVNPGEPFTIVGRVEDSNWYTVETSNGAKGWVRADLVNVDPSVVPALPVTPPEVVAEISQPVEPANVVAAVEPTAPEVSLPTPPSGPPEGQTTSTVRMRSKPSTNGVVLGTVKAGTVVRLRFRSLDSTWYSVERSDGTIGWISGQFVTVDPMVASNLEVASSDSAIVIPPTAVPAPPMAAAQPVAPAARAGCDLSYPTICIPAGSGDLDCPEIPHRRFQVIGRDPHGFDRDNDGVGCESN